MITTPIRAKRSRIVHLTRDATGTLCGLRLKGPIIDPDATASCMKCLTVLL